MTYQPRPIDVTAQKLVEVHREIGSFLDPSLFFDPVYDILLSLLAAEDSGTSVEVSDGVRFANVLATTAHRYFKLLEVRGLIFRLPNLNDTRRCSLALTPKCRSALRAYIEQVTVNLGG